MLRPSCSSPANSRRWCGLVASQVGGTATLRPARSPNWLPWLAKAWACCTPAIATFTAGLEADGAAVRAALIQPRSSGQTESLINRLKLLKRQCYGRAGFDLLRRRVLMAT